MKFFVMMLLLSGLFVISGCTTPAPIEFEEEVIAPIETVETEEPTFEPEIPVTTDEDIVTQPDTSL